MQLLWIFPLYAFLGWCLEVIYCSVTTGKFVNRGFLNGCICPIYGFGAGLVILSLTSVRYNLFLVFFGAALLGSFLELVGGFLLKRAFHLTWWDYSEEPFNLGGYICLKFSLAWGVIGLLLIQVIHPPLAYLVLSIPYYLLRVLLVLFYLYFMVDVAITVLTVRKLDRDLQEITRLSALINRGSDFLAEGIGDSAIEAARRIEASGFAGRARTVRGRIHAGRMEARSRLRRRLHEFERFTALLEYRGRIRSRLFRAFPNLKASDNGGALRELKARIGKRGKRDE